LNTAHPVNAEIIAIGTEILLGELTDTNSVYLARTLRDMGIDVYFMTSVGDNEKRIESAVRIALGRARIVLTCGGLGPTVDDMTRSAVAAAADRGLVFHESLLERIAERFSSFRVQMTENNRRQAYVPDGAVIIDNPVGTAPAFAVEIDDQVIICLPGVPREMKYLMIEKVIPYLRERYGMKSEIIKARVLKVAGIGESALDELIGTELLNASNPTVGLNAHSGQIDVRVTAKAEHADAADALIAPMVEALRARIGRYVYGMDDARLEDALISALVQRGMTVCLAEVGVQTEITTRLKMAGNSRIEFSGQYNRAHDLSADLNLTAGGSLRAQAEAAAAALCTRHQGAAIVILSEPSGAADSADDSEHTAVAVSIFGGQTVSRGYGFGAESEAAHVWTVTWTMAMLWRMLTEGDRR
jgi:nicotinamide-nucleotide amidase